MLDSNTFQRFLFEELHIRGEWVRLGTSFQDATKGVEYPPRVKALLGQTIAAAVLMTGTLKFSGRLSVHARGEGPVSLLTAEATNKRTFRGLANWKGDIKAESTLNELLGNAQLVITIEPDQGSRYQGIVALDKENLSECLAHYFELSEQLDTYLFLVADDTSCHGLMLQRLPGFYDTKDFDVKDHDTQGHDTEDQDAWNRVVQLAKTLSPKEFTDTDNETLLLRLFHQEKIISYEHEKVSFACSCSEERTLASIKTLGKEEALSILETKASISVDCQFCGVHYKFDREDINSLFHIGKMH